MDKRRVLDVGFGDMKRIASYRFKYRIRGKI